MVADLAERHECVGELFPRPVTREDWDRYRLSDAQVAHFHEHGYVAGVRVFTDAHVDRLREELQGLFDPAHPGNGLF